MSDNNLPTTLICKKQDSNELLSWYDEDENKIYDFSKEFILDPYDKEYNSAFYKFIYNVISPDCYGIAIDEEVIFNFYLDKNYKDTIIDDILMQAIFEDIHSTLITQLYMKTKDIQIKFYMSAIKPWCYYLNYNNENMSFIMTVS